MSVFAEIMTDTAVPALAAIFGDPATYAVADPAATLTVSAILTRNVAVPNGLTGATEVQTRIEIPTADLNGTIPRRGDVVTIGTERWLVLARDSDDGYFSRLIVRPGDD